MPFKYFVEESRKNYGRHVQSDDGLQELSLNTGALMRIADATEKMAKSYDALRQDRDFHQERCRNLEKSIAHLKRSNASLWGHVGLMKHKLRSLFAEFTKLRSERNNANRLPLV